MQLFPSTGEQNPEDSASQDTRTANIFSLLMSTRTSRHTLHGRLPVQNVNRPPPENIARGSSKARAARAHSTMQR
eukprot:3548469-Rhodomonas_salina.2